MNAHPRLVLSNGSRLRSASFVASCEDRDHGWFATGGFGGSRASGTRLAELIAEEEMTDVAACNLARCTRDTSRMEKIKNTSNNPERLAGKIQVFKINEYHADFVVLFMLDNVRVPDGKNGCLTADLIRPTFNKPCLPLTWFP